MEKNVEVLESMVIFSISSTCNQTVGTICENEDPFCDQTVKSYHILSISGIEINFFTTTSSTSKTLLVVLKVSNKIQCYLIFKKQFFLGFWGGGGGVTTNKFKFFINKESSIRNMQVKNAQMTRTNKRIKRGNKRKIYIVT